MSNTIDKKTQRRLDKLDALEAGGVDNWEWYGESLKDWFAENEIEECLDDFIEELNCVLAEAHIHEPAGTGCGYAIEFDEDFIKTQLLGVCEKYLQIQQDK